MDILGNKVVLRTVEDQDKEMMLNLIKDPEITKVTGGYSHLTSYNYQINGFRSAPDSVSSLYSTIADKESPQIGLGIIILSNIDLKKRTAEMYIKLMKSARRKGYGQDAVNTLVSYAFREFRLNCIYSNILEYNIASRTLFEKCGFKQEGIHKSRIYKDGHYRNVCFYEIKNDGMSDKE